MKRRSFITLLGGAAAAWPLAAQQPKTARIGALYIGVADAESFKKELREGLELDSGRIHVRRAKNGVDSTHPLTGKEIRALRQLRRENLQSRFVFNTERSGPVTRAWFLKMVRRTGELAKLPFPIHPHMLRHACGFKLANDGVDTRALQHFLGTQHHAHGAVYRTALRSFRRVLEGLTPQRIAEQRQRDFQAERPRGGLEVNDELDLGESDIVIVHAPLTESTHHLINREQLALIRPGGIIINVSRGGVVDTAAVIETLRSGIFPLRAWMCWNPSRKCRPNCAHIRSNAHAPCCFHVRHFPAGFAEARG